MHSQLVAKCHCATLSPLSLFLSVALAEIVYHRISCSKFARALNYAATRRARNAIDGLAFNVLRRHRKAARCTPGRQLWLCRTNDIEQPVVNGTLCPGVADARNSHLAAIVGRRRGAVRGQADVVAPRGAPRATNVLQVVKPSHCGLIDDSQPAHTGAD